MVALDTSLDKGWVAVSNRCYMSPLYLGEMESNFTNMFPFKGVETTNLYCLLNSDHYDAFESLLPRYERCSGGFKNHGFSLGAVG